MQHKIFDLLLCFATPFDLQMLKEAEDWFVDGKWMKQWQRKAFKYVQIIIISTKCASGQLIPRFSQFQKTARRVLLRESWKAYQILLEKKI